MPLDQVVAQVQSMPARWHGAGSLSAHVLSAIARHTAGRQIRASAETGTGKSTLLFSHCSERHTVFAQDDRGQGDSLVRVQESPLLRRDAVRFVVGATQRTLPAHVFDRSLDVVMLDGPHGYPFPELEYYYLYQHLAEGALLIVDDIHIPTVFNLFAFLREDAMFHVIEVVETTAFFVRTSAPMFDPLADGWWLQQYNERRFPVRDGMIRLSMTGRLKRALPAPLKQLIERLLGRSSGSPA